MRHAHSLFPLLLVSTLVYSTWWVDATSIAAAPNQDDVVALHHRGDVGIPSSRIVLFGSTGNLARRFIWQALFDFYIELGKRSNGVQVIACVRRASAASAVADIIERNVSCTSASSGVGVTTCSEHKKRFFQLSVRIATYDPIDGGAGPLASMLSTPISSSHLDDEKGARPSWERSRVFFLCTPPSAYVPIAQYIRTHLIASPFGSSSRWDVRLVLEKPFGSSLNSSTTLWRTLAAQGWPSSSVYLVDHYLGKRAVRSHAQFVRENALALRRDLVPNVSSIAVQMEESSSAAKRTRTYTELGGVLSDTMQSHASVLISTLLSEMNPSCPHTPTAHSSASSSMRRASVLRNTRLQHANPPIIGRYDRYHQECLEDGWAPMDGQLDKVYTAAMVTLHHSNRGYDGIVDDDSGFPIRVFGGKSLSKRACSVSFVFGKGRALVFRVHGPMEAQRVQMLRDMAVCESSPSMLHGEAIELWWKGYAPSDGGVMESLKPPTGWKSCFDETKGVWLSWPQEALPSKGSHAYGNVIREAIAGQDGSFVSPQEAIAQWTLWDPIQSMARATPQENVMIYRDGEDCWLFSNTELVPARCGASIREDGVEWVRDEL